MATAVTQIPMPQMGVSVEEGTITGWLKSPGDAVAEGDVLCEISTDKVDTEVTAPSDGVLVRVLADVGDTVPVGEPLAELAPAGTTDLPPEPIPDAVGAAGRDGGEPER